MTKIRHDVRWFLEIQMIQGGPPKERGSRGRGLFAGAGWLGNYPIRVRRPGSLFKVCQRAPTAVLVRSGP